MREVNQWGGSPSTMVRCILALLGTVACTGNRSASPETPPEGAGQVVQEYQAAPPSADPSAGLSPEQTVPSQSAEPPVQPEPVGASEPAGTTPSRQVSEACEALCARMDRACPRASKVCRASCDDYEDGAEKCPVEIYEALRCQQNAEDFLLCSNVSPEDCAKQVRAMQDCRSGKVPPASWGENKHEEEAATAVPSGWTRLEHSSGFSLLLPTGAQWKAQDGAEQALVDVGGEEYRARRLSLEGKKITDALILRLVSAEVGHACEAKLKIHGRYETGETIHVRFQTPCKGEQDYYGVLHVRGGYALLVYIHRTAPVVGQPEHLDSLVFGYEESAR